MPTRRRGSNEPAGSGSRSTLWGAVSVRRMEVFADLIRTRRTHKSFGPDPVAPETLDQLFELARWAPNHHRTNPWRFRVVGFETLARLKEAAGPAEAPKLERAPTLVVASVVLTGDLEQD